MYIKYILSLFNIDTLLAVSAIHVSNTWMTSDDKLQIPMQLSFHKFVVQNTFMINYFVVGPL